MFVGHPVVAIPSGLVLGGLAMLGVVQNGFDWPVLIMLVLAGAVGTCAREAARYRAWKREWDAHDPNYRPPQHLRNTGKVVGALVVAATALWLAGNYNDPASSAHTIVPLLVFGLPVLGLLLLARRTRKRSHQSPSNQVVTQAISRPLSAPTVAQAYARLPEYLRPLFTPQTEGAAHQ